MKNYLVKALINFNDNEEDGARRTPEETFYCTKERFEFLRDHNAVMLLEIIKQEEPKKKETKKKTSKK